MSQRLLKPKDLAEWLGMSIYWVYKQVESSSLPFHRVGKAIRFDPEEIRDYLNERKGMKR